MSDVEPTASTTFMVDGRHVDAWGGDVVEVENPMIAALTDLSTGNQPTLPSDDLDEEEDGEEIENIEADDYEEHTTQELRAMLSGRDLAIDGKKADLVARLREADAK